MRAVLLSLLLFLPGLAQPPDLDRRVDPEAERGTLSQALERLRTREEIQVVYPPELANVELSGVYPASYRPTLRELLEALGRDTGTSPLGLRLAAPAQPLPFRLTLAEGWTQEDRGSYLFTCPPYAPAGMDVYLLGSYSFEDPDQVRQLRNEQALRAAREMRPEATLEDMRPATVDGAEALYYETHPFPNRAWRQWVFFKNGRLFMIVSAGEPKVEVRLRREVDQMVESFSVR